MDEKLGSAVYSLAVGPGVVQDRLYDAFLSFHTLEDDDFPAELLDRWQSIYARLTRHADPAPLEDPHRRGDVQHTLERTSSNDASQIARDIYDLHYAVESYIEEHPD